MEKETWIIVGLGNPGAQFAHTRHNAGFDVTDILAARWNVTLNRLRCRGMLAEIPMGDKRVVLCQPQTMMNLSGECIAALLSWYKCPLDHLLVIYDDIDLPQGRLRVRMTGSAGTHNGMRSIIAHTPSQSFPRIRVGVGARPDGWDLVKWVLGHYLTQEERTLMQGAFLRAADCAEDWLRNGIDHAMRTFNVQV